MALSKILFKQETATLVSDTSSSYLLVDPESQSFHCRLCWKQSKENEAQGFCLDCRRNLCVSCRKRHQKHHRVLRKPQQISVWGKLAQNKYEHCVELCSKHPFKVIIYHCLLHDDFGCEECIILEHKDCDIELIPEKSAGKHFMKTVHDVSQAINELDSLKQEGEHIILQNLTTFKRSNETIEQFERRFHKLKKDVSREAIGLKDRVDSIVDKIAKLLSELRKLFTTMKDSRATDPDSDVFSSMKQAQSILKTFNVQTFRNELSEVKYVFQPNVDLGNMCSMPNALGTFSALSEQAKSNHTILNQKLDIEISSKIESDACIFKDFITGCALISNDKLLLANYNKCKLKVVDTRQQTVVDEICLDSNPFDIAVLIKQRAAVSLPMAKLILIMNTSGKMKKNACIRMLVNCFGVTSHQQLLYVVCKKNYENEYYITVLNTECEERIQKIALPSPVICPKYIALSNDQKQLYISDQCTDSLVAFSIHEKGISVYKNNSLKNPTGLVVLENGSILVCSKGMGTILLVTADFRLGRIVANNVPGVQSICYQPNSLRVFVGSVDFDRVQVFSLGMGARTSSQNQTDPQVQQSADSGLHKILL